MKEHKGRKGEEADSMLKKHNRKSYVKPQLVEYGHVEKLTQMGASGNVSDAILRRQTR